MDKIKNKNFSTKENNMVFVKILLYRWLYIIGPFSCVVISFSVG